MQASSFQRVCLKRLSSQLSRGERPKARLCAIHNQNVARHPGICPDQDLEQIRS